MTIENWNQIFRWTTVILAVVLAFAGIGAKITGNIINQRKNAEIQSLKSRSLVSQAAKMIAVARQLCLQIKRVPVTAANGNQEAQAYALEFVNVFRNAPPCASDLALPIPGLRPDVQGIKVGVRDIVNIPPEVHLIEQVPHAGDIQYSVDPLAPDFFADEPFVLIVGAKPPS